MAENHGWWTKLRTIPGDNAFQRLKPKVFGLGLSKTGTTSLGDGLEMLGLSRMTWSRSSVELVKAFEHGDMQRLFDVAYRYDALEDLPWSYAYRALDRHFPNARFILTRRKDVATWARSIHRQTLGKPRNRFYANKATIGHHFFYENPQAFIEYYERHNREVASYFEDRHPSGGRFIEMCFEEGDGWGKLCGFLGLPKPDVAFPHSNPRKRRWYKDLYINTFFRKHKNAAIEATETRR